LGWLRRWGRGWRSRKSSRDGGLVTDKGDKVTLPHVYPVAYKEQPVFEYLDSNYGAILGGPRDKRKAVI
jgi:hypothetical protein